MATTTTPDTGELRLVLDDILVGDNVCDVDQEHVENLAQSIALRGLLVPLIVRPTNAGYELVAGYHRYHACRKLTLTDVLVVVRDRAGTRCECTRWRSDSAAGRGGLYERSSKPVGGALACRAPSLADGVRHVGPTCTTGPT